MKKRKKSTGRKKQTTRIHKIEKGGILGAQETKKAS